MLDTDIVSYIVKEKPSKAKARMQALLPSALCVSVVTRAELMYGLKQLSASHRTPFAVRQFLGIVQTLAWDAEASDWYAEIRHQLTTTGKLIGELDIMIAAHAISQDAVLVTNNLRHYQRVKAPLMLENWA
jgi:tRNA(fMet)-specific endonuclease VapC